MARLYLVHIDDEPGGPDEEVGIIVPGTGRTIVLAPIDALPRLLELYDEALGDGPEQRCDCCSRPLRPCSRSSLEA